MKHTLFYLFFTNENFDIYKMRKCILTQMSKAYLPTRWYWANEGTMTYIIYSWKGILGDGWLRKNWYYNLIKKIKTTSGKTHDCSYKARIGWRRIKWLRDNFPIKEPIKKIMMEEIAKVIT